LPRGERQPQASPHIQRLIHGSVDWRDMPRLDIDSERIYEMKGHLTALRAHEAKLDVELSERS